VPYRMPRAAGEERPRRSRLLWVGLPVVTVFAVFGGIVWLAYQENARVPTGEPPLIKAVAAPYKLAPDDPGGREVADQGSINDLLRDEPRPAQPERVLPLPEEPRAPVIVAAPPPSDPAVPPEPAATPGPGAADAVQEAQAALGRLLADVAPAEAPAAPAAPDPAVAVPAMRPAAPSATAPTTVRPAAPQVAPAVDAPSQEADAALTRLLAEVAGVPPEPAAETAAEPPASPRAVAAMAPAQPVSARTMGPGFRVQLAAVRAQDDVQRAWADLSNRLGSLVADREPYYERAETANGVFYRIQLGPFAREADADRLCSEVKQRNASCFVVLN
jgi:SPOR domain